MITLDQETIDAFSESGFEPVVHVTIDITESDASHTYLRGHNYSGSLASTVGGEHIVSICEVIAPSIDPLERSVEVGSARIEYFSQDVFRSMMNAGKKFINAEVTVRLGAPSLSLSRYATYFNGFIEKIETRDQTVLVTAKEYTAKLQTRMNLRTFVDDHPIEVIKQLMIDSGISDGKIDSTTFDHDAFSSIQHYAYSSRGASYGEDTYEPDESQVSSADGHQNNSLNPEGYGPGSGRFTAQAKFAWRLPPDDFVSEVCRMMRVSMIYDPSQNEFKLIQFDSSSSAVRHFTVDDYTDFDKKDVHGPYNRTEIQVGNYGVTTKLVLTDSTSIASYGEQSYSNTSQYLSPCSFYIDQTDVEWGSDYGGPYTNKVTIGQGFAGTRDIVPEGSQPAASKISSSNPFYGLWRNEILKSTSPHNPDDGGYAWQVMYDKNGRPLAEHTASISGATKANPCVITAVAHDFDNGDQIRITGVNGMSQLNGNDYIVQNKTYNSFELFAEILGSLVAVNSTSYDTYTGAGTATLNQEYIDNDFVQTFNNMQLQGITRAFAGSQGDATDAQARGLYDITAAYDFSQHVLSRYSNGAPEIEFFAPLHHIDIELGDLITIDHDTFMDVGLALDGLDSNVKFEVTRKEVTALGDSVGIQFGAVYATKTSPPSTNIVTIKPPAIMDSEYIGGIKFGTLRENSSTNSIKSGLVVSAGSGLVANIAAGEANFSGKVRALPAQASITMTASKHTYIGIDGITGRMLTTEVATSAAEPTISPNEIRLAKVVTDGSGITSVSDLRQFGNISVDQIKPQAVKPGENLIWNPSFDIWPNPGLKPAGWSIDSGVMNTDIFRSDSGTHSGLYRVRMVDTSTVATMSSKKVPINRNRPHRASAWVYHDDSHAITLKILWWKGDRTASSTASSTIYSASPTDSEWVNITGVASPPSDAVYASLEISRAANPGDEGMWDDVYLGEEPVSFKATGTATTSLTVKVENKIQVNTEAHDYGGNYDNSSNYRFTVPEAGTYAFEASAHMSYTGGSTYTYAVIKKNGSTDIAKSYAWPTDTSTTHDMMMHLQTGAVELAKGDYVEFYIHPEVQTSATLDNTASSLWFAGNKLS